MTSDLPEHRPEPDFNLCPECLAEYQALRWAKDAERRQNLLPLGTIIWSDEHPTDDRGRHHRPWRCSDSCRASIGRLVAARGCYWADEEIPPKYQEVWAQAKAAIPDWPGFQRLYLSAEDRLAVDAAEQDAADSLGELLGMADQVEVDHAGDGTASFTVTFDLDDDCGDPPDSQASRSAAVAGVIQAWTFVAFGFVVTNLTVVGRGVVPFPWLSAGLYLGAALTGARFWRRQDWLARVCALPAALAGGVMGLETLRLAISRL